MRTSRSPPRGRAGARPGGRAGWALRRVPLAERSAFLLRTRRAPVKGDEREELRDPPKAVLRGDPADGDARGCAPRPAYEGHRAAVRLLLRAGHALRARRLDREDGAARRMPVVGGGDSAVPTSTSPTRRPRPCAAVDAARPGSTTSTTTSPPHARVAAAARPDPRRAGPCHVPRWLGWPAAGSRRDGGRACAAPRTRRRGASWAARRAVRWQRGLPLLPRPRPAGRGRDGAALTCEAPRRRAGALPCSAPCEASSFRPGRPGRGDVTGGAAQVERLARRGPRGRLREQQEPDAGEQQRGSHHDREERDRLREVRRVERGADRGLGHPHLARGVVDRLAVLSGAPSFRRSSPAPLAVA